MLSQIQNETLGCLKSFSDLNGWRKQEVIAGDNEDARLAKFSFKSRVAKGWPSQWHTKFKDGYIEFENGKRFDIANQTIGAKRAFLFLVTPAIDILWRRQTLEHQTRGDVDKMAPKDQVAATQLIRELTDPEVSRRRFPRYPFPAALRALSVPQLEDLATLFATAGDNQRAPVSFAVA